ncbi:MAG: hypothetical protein ACM3MG_00130 [Bacillota bacterium]
MLVKKILLAGVLAISLPHRLWAGQSLAIKTEASTCTDCISVQTPNGPRLQNNLSFVAGSIEKINQTLNFAPECSKFADNGQLGSWAKSIRNVFMTEDLTYLQEGSPDIQKYCPTYSQMKDTDKANFWVLVLNAMAHFENSCNTANKRAAQGPNGQLVGILQLHSQHEGAYVPKGADCRNGDGRTAEGSFRCAMIMLNSQLKSKKALFARSSYWEVLRPQAGSRRVPVIINAIKKYGPCQDVSKLHVAQYNDFNDDAEILSALSHMEDGVRTSKESVWYVEDITAPVKSGSGHSL